jgi:hypothetical protein
MAASATTHVDEVLTIGVGPVTLPDHLDHKGIVTHDQRYRVNLAEYDRWAEPLDHNITRVLSENLSILIPSDQVIAYPRGVSHSIDYTVRVSVITFASDPDGKVVLSAAWMIHDAAKAPVKLAKTRYSVPRRGDDVVALVEAMSQAIEQLSQDIASAITAAAQSIE